MVIDPQRDLDRILGAIDAAGIKLTHVLETHVHNDYVSGGLALERRTGATYVVCADDEARFEHLAIRDGEEIRSGTLVLRAVHRPGHTHTHLSYVGFDSNAEAKAVFTGGSLLYGTVGRTDLVAEHDTDQLTRAQYHSGRRLVEELTDDVEVYPTHGFGSFCASSGGGDRASGTIDDEDDFVQRLVSGLTDHPTYYAHMALLNLAGPFEASLAPPALVNRDELAQRLHDGEWVVDLRARTVFAADHLGGSISIELDDPFSTHLGWLIAWGTRLTLLGTTVEEVADAQRQLVRIGIDQLGGATTGPLDEIAPGIERRSYRVSDFAGLAAELTGRAAQIAVVDVRRSDEWNDTHVTSSHNAPLHELLTHLHHVPDGELWVHCASGYRAAIAVVVGSTSGTDLASGEPTRSGAFQASHATLVGSAVEVACRR